MGIAAQRQANVAMPGQPLGNFWRRTTSHNPRNVKMPQRMEVSHTVRGVAIGEEVALLGLGSLAGILE